MTVKRFQIYVLFLKLFAAVSSFECERSGIALKQLNTYLHASIWQKRSIVLSFNHISYSINIDVAQVLQIFSRWPRALEYTSICSLKIILLNLHCIFV